MESVPSLVIGGLTLIRPVGLASIPLVMVARKEEAFAGYSKYVTNYYPANPSNEKELLEVLLKTGEYLNNKHGNKIVLYYGTDSDLRVIYNYRDLLSNHYLFILNDAEVSESMIDKWKFFSLSKNNNFDVPETILVKDLHSNIDEIEYPVIVKPRVTFSQAKSKEISGFIHKHGKAKIFTTKSELIKCDELWNISDELILQKYIVGTDKEIFSYHGFSTEKGELIAAFTGKKIRTFPKLIGYSSYIELIKDDVLLEIGRNIVDKLNLKGVFKIDFKKNVNDGRYYMMEINARYNLWHYLGAVNGINLPHIAYQYLMFDKKAYVNRYRTNYRWLDFPKDYHAYKELRSEGAISLNQWIGSLISSKKIYENFSWKDPIPFLVWSKNLIIKKIKGK